jgi:hypothetical protein
MFFYDNTALPEPGVGPFVKLADLPVGTWVLGLAPIGVRWRAIVDKKGLKPEGNCPRSQFCPTTARVNGRWMEIHHG